MRRADGRGTLSVREARFCGYVRRRMPTVVVNEVVCKSVCHNIGVLVQEAEEVKIAESI